jgi:urea transport system substrate-binding protein
VISVSVGEGELRALNIGDLVGDYAAWDYFQSVDRPENKSFVERFKARYGADRTLSDVMETSYFSVYLWAQAIADAGGDDTRRIRKAMLTQSLNAPEGVVSVDPETQHTWRSFHVGKIRADGQLDLVWSAQKPIRPSPYPLSRSKEEWERFLDSLYTGWGNKWANPVERK